MIKQHKDSSSRPGILLKLEKQIASQQIVLNRQQVKARVARKNHRVKVELSLHPDRIKSQEEQERKVPNNNRLEILLIREKQIARLQINREIHQRVRMLHHKRRRVQALKRKDKKREQVETLKINWHKGRRETLLGQGKKIASQLMVPNKQLSKRVREKLKDQEVLNNLHPVKIRSPGLDLLVPSRLLKRDRKAGERLKKQEVLS